ncbi:ABC-type glycerol-3-phosphate transport system, permease component [Halolactibacillus halophilus]|uniref:ABC transporter permease n=1 Tax=Halolactibacillus halophilus TaxID=306540 RepID=A0A1I5M6B2_9BACI|nr:carbohydrate ABC transporter permease [Halolactibacillus halophilus]GEM01031.1 ABC transporter permease [Halolactibacillus halophilus]SFP05050.1 ABC-type glycerol-3-phosphate transport system, permease component [Halolactibacillus halophilus]
MASSFHGSKINPDRFDRSQIKFFLFLMPMMVFMGLPIVYIFSHAFKPIDELFAYPPRFFVEKPTLANFVDLFNMSDTTGVPMSRYLFNSIIVTVVVVALTIAMSTAAAYALSKKKFKLKALLFEINTVALMFVPIAVAIPRYLLIDNIGLLDSFWAHILPLLAMPVGLFLVKQFIDQIPDSLIESARMDGASDYIIYWKIILPLVKPAIATIAILSFQAVWNNVETSTLFVNDESLKTFAFFMSTLASQTGNSVAGQGMAAAASLLMFVPNLIIFIILQSQVMNTMAHSGIK